MSNKGEIMKCTDCTRCPYDYCINEENEIKEAKDRTEYFKEYQEHNRERINSVHKKNYQEKKRQGICIRCNKKATHSLYCYEHWTQQKRKSTQRAQIRKRDRHERGLINEYRLSHGLCLWCGEKASGGTHACDKHRAIFLEASLKANKDYIRSQNKLIFEGETK